MSGFLKFSDAASLGLHAAAFLARENVSGASVRQMARALGASQAHLSKVLQRLTKAGVVGSLRGPSGGYELARPARGISLKRVYEAIEGPLDASVCPFNIPACRGSKCVLGGEFVRKGKELVRHLADTPLSSLELVLEGDAGRGRKRSRGRERARPARPPGGRGATTRGARRTAKRRGHAGKPAGL